MNTAIRDDARATALPAPLEAIGVHRDGQGDLDIPFASTPKPRETRPGGPRSLDAAPRRAAVRRPRDGRPATAARLDRRGSVRAPLARAPHGADGMRTRVERAEVGFAALAIAALLSALAVTALIAIAHWRADGLPGEAPSPSSETVQQWSGEYLPR
ncbi:hypothetical protein [Nocardia arizonensis]|uniref:hypothetical protein n=1 Tax=Nocardia arizonensis TaxID=1141647 RepID=UPI0006D0EC13|nr:hypothetical protein [Nocardia arizonensis]